MIFPLLLCWVAFAETGGIYAERVYFTKERMEVDKKYPGRFKILVAGLPVSIKDNGLIKDVTVKHFPSNNRYYKAIQEQSDKEEAFYEKMLKVQFPFVLTYMGYYSANDEQNLIFEFAKHDTLRNFIDSKVTAERGTWPTVVNFFTGQTPLFYYPPTLGKLRYIAANLILGIAFIHEEDLVHGYLQPENIFVTKN